MIFGQFIDQTRLKLSLSQGSKRLESRRKSAGSAWDNHLQATRSFILENMTKTPPHKAIILGSGPLFDVPLEDLANHFEDVELVDIDHPKSAQNAAKAYKNVTLRTCDVTGINQILEQAVRTKDTLPAPCPPLDLLEGADFIVSLNLISQIPVWPYEVLKRHKKQNDAYLASLIQNHLDWLKAAPGLKCVIGDVEQHVCEDATTIHTEDILYGVKLPLGEKTWIWKIAPKPLWDKNYDLHHKVAAFCYR